MIRHVVVIVEPPLVLHLVIETALLAELFLNDMLVVQALQTQLLFDLLLLQLQLSLSLLSSLLDQLSEGLVALVVSRDAGNEPFSKFLT